MNIVKLTAAGFRVVCNCLIFLHLCVIQSIAWAEENGIGKQTIESLNKQFSANPKQPVPYWIPVTVILLVLVLVIWVVYQIYSYTQNHDKESPWYLYKKLCKVHQLTFIEKRVVNKVLAINELSDPLPIFVEPEYLKNALTNEALKNDQAVILTLLEKLFLENAQEQTKQSITENPPQKTVTHQETETKTVAQSSAPAEPTQPPISQTSQNVDSQKTAAPASFSQNKSEEKMEIQQNQESIMNIQLSQEKFSTVSEENKNFSNKVLLSPIPGGKAFSSLAEPIGQISSEIAAVSIQYNLSNSNGLNSRKFENSPQQRETESATPYLFPKPHAPSTEEILSERKSRTDEHSVPSPTPKYLQEKQRTAAKGNTKNRPQNSGHPFGHSHLPKTGEMFTMEDIHLLESIVMKR